MDPRKVIANGSEHGRIINPTDSNDQSSETETASARGGVTAEQD
ncbi:hypothetical protein [Halostagnicola larsenii]|nr:hypothetical protein [Halostagnicola larsenii]